MGKIKYLTAYIIPLLAFHSFNSTGFLAYLGLIIIFVLIPFLEIILPPSSYNLNAVEKTLAEEDTFYDWVIYMLVPIHFFLIYFFLTTIDNPALALSDIVARVLMMGIILAFIGINMGHDLGHKTQNPGKQIIAQVLLTTAIQNHFMAYHNGGHHKDIGTPNDPTSAKKGDNYYFFALKSQIGGYFKTWKLESKRLKAQGKKPVIHPMTIYTLLPLLLLIGIFLSFGLFITVSYFLAAIFGISILEAQNYFAHYGLRRKMLDNGRYERVNAKHSWNSDHIIGRLLFFELTRHSDHHHHGAKPFQVLESKEESPLLPFGYPVMLLLTYLPFLFKPVMAKQLEKYGMS
jgi:alkane 1-monooxygenase